MFDHTMTADIRQRPLHIQCCLPVHASSVGYISALQHFPPTSPFCGLVPAAARRGRGITGNWVGMFRRSLRTGPRVTPPDRNSRLNSPPQPLQALKLHCTV